MTKDTKSEQLVTSTAAAPVELSETELGQVTGGDGNKTNTTTSTNTGTTKTPYVVYKINDVIIT